MSRVHVGVGTRIAAFGILLGTWAMSGTAAAQLTANSLADLRSLGLSSNNTTVTLSSTGGDPHPVTGVVTPGHYWINGDHIANPTNSEPIFMELSGTGNTYDLSGATINLDTRKLDGFGRNLGHGSGVDVIRITGSNNTIQGINLIGQDIALDTNPSAQRYADWATQFVVLSGDNNTVDGAHVVTRGSRTDSYGLGDAFGKGASQGISPFLGHRKASAFRVGDATNAVINDMHLQVNTFGHGFFVQTSTNTTLTNSTVTGELFPSQGVIDHPLYEQYGTTYHQNEIPDDILISGAEGGVRMYTGSSGITVENVVVTNMRAGFSTSLGGGTKTLNNVEAYGVEAAFGVGTNTTITNAKADGVNGPVVVFDRSDVRDTTVEVELVGDQPFNTDYALAYVNGNRVNVSFTSDRPAEDFEDTTVFRTAQFYYDNWRETNNTTVFDVPGYDHINSVLVNDTNAVLVLGEQAEGNVGRSLGPVISSGLENHYDGLTLVPAGSRLEVVHAKGLGNSGTETGAEFDNNFNVSFTGTATAQTLETNASIVESGGTLELAPGIRITNEKLTISGNGVDGAGALYSDGQSGSGTRFGSSSGGDQSTIFLDGNASIGVGIAGNQLLVGSLQGTGNFTKRGPGKLSIEKASTFAGSFTVAQGEVVARSNVVNGNLTVNNGASVASIGDNAINTTGTVFLFGTMDLNARSDDNGLTARTGQLFGPGIIRASNSAASEASTLTIEVGSSEASFTGQIRDQINLVKTGVGMQAVSGNNSYSGTTTVDEGVFQVNGTHTGGGDYTVNDGGTLGGTGVIASTAVVQAGGTLAPGASAGELSIDNVDLQAGSQLEIELGGAGHDLLTVTGAITLGGDLAISLIDDAAPYASDTFVVVAADTLTGVFDNVANGDRVETAGGEGSFAVVYGSAFDQVILADFLPSGLAGDYNNDGLVDASDYTLWRDAEGQTGMTPFSGADGTGDGQVNAADYALWSTNFGTTEPAEPTNAVPEPTALLLLLLGTSVGMSRHTRR